MARCLLRIVPTLTLDAEFPTLTVRGPEGINGINIWNSAGMAADGSP